MDNVLAVYEPWRAYSSAVCFYVYVCAELLSVSFTIHLFSQLLLCASSVYPVLTTLFEFVMKQQVFFYMLLHPFIAVLPELSASSHHENINSLSRREQKQ